MTKTILETLFLFQKQYWKLYFCIKNNIGNFIFEDEENFFAFRVYRKEIFIIFAVFFSLKAPHGWQG